jgi:hypothetical protein
LRVSVGKTWEENDYLPGGHRGGKDSASGLYEIKGARRPQDCL